VKSPFKFGSLTGSFLFYWLGWHCQPAYLVWQPLWPRVWFYCGKTYCLPVALSHHSHAYACIHT